MFFTNQRFGLFTGPIGTTTYKSTGDFAVYMSPVKSFQLSQLRLLNVVVI